MNYSQHGEDVEIIRLFDQLGIDRPSYLDVGAFHPFTISNTAMLYERGSRGINVDADHEAIALFERHRPDDINLHVGVGPEEGEATFYRSTETEGCNSFIRKHLERIAPVTSEETVRLTTLRTIVDQHAHGVFPHFLNLDIEGMDGAVLKTAGLRRNGPLLICVEAVREWEAQAIFDLLEPQGYEFVKRMTHNDLYVRR